MNITYFYTSRRIVVYYPVYLISNFSRFSSMTISTFHKKTKTFLHFDLITMHLRLTMFMYSSNWDILVQKREWKVKLSFLSTFISVNSQWVWFCLYHQVTHILILPCHLSCIHAYTWVQLTSELPKVCKFTKRVTEIPCLSLILI